MGQFQPHGMAKQNYHRIPVRQSPDRGGFGGSRQKAEGRMNIVSQSRGDEDGKAHK